MKYIEKLLQGVEVEWKKLGEMVEIVTDFTAAGSFASNAKNVTYLKEPSYALLVRTTDLKQRFTNSDNFVYVDDHAFNYLWRVNLNNESIILPNVGNCGEVYYSVPTELPYDRCVLGPNALLLRSSIIRNKFLFYWFQGADFQNKLSKIISSTGQTKFNKTNLKHILIPIPPLHVQQEIVRILDKFTELETELETELALRKQQYERYRDQLLSPDKGLSETEVEWKKLGEVAELRRGRVISKGYLNENAGLYPVYSSQTENMGEIGRIRTFDFDQESITWTTDGAKAGTVFHRKGRFSITNVCGLIKIRDIQAIGYRYLYYWLSIEAKKHVYLGMGNPKLMSNQMERVPIPIPPLHVQQEIVRILDKFHTLTTSISEGLPREIELRKQQYAYYRDQLLSFER